MQHSIQFLVPDGSFNYTTYPFKKSMTPHCRLLEKFKMKSTSNIKIFHISNISTESTREEVVVIKI